MSKDDDHSDDNDPASDTYSSDSETELARKRPKKELSIKTEPKYTNPSEVAESDMSSSFGNQAEIEVDTSTRIDDDEDKLFLMSVLPTLRSLNTENKLEARIQILKVVKEISLRQSNESKNK